MPIFGKKTLPFEDKMRAVNEVFSSVSAEYDIMNDAMSLGAHRLWKRLFVSKVADFLPSNILDMAAGTCDITKLLRGALPHAYITAADANAQMLEKGQQRLLDGGVYKGLDFVVTQAENLPFPSCSFDAYTISFGLRNVTGISEALGEAFRVLKNKGRFWCMEFHPLSADHFLKPFYNAYLENVLPFLGEVMAHNRESYQYLCDSIQSFLSAQELQEELKKAGFSYVFSKPLMGGIVIIHEAIK